MTKSKSQKVANTGVKANSDTGNKKPTKAKTILDLLRSKNGASIDDMTKATGWQSHSVRGFLSGTVKKRMGLAVENEPDKDGVRRYRIASSEPVAASQ